MPRRKQAFIDRTRAQTFQLVQTAAPNAPSTHVFVPINAAANAGVTDNATAEGGVAGVDVSAWDTGYNRGEYELGEYGFPDDGYDYAKHFRRIGGGGGVFMDAVSGGERPDMVSGSLASGSGGVVGGGEGVGDGDVGAVADWRRREDVDRVEEAIEEIRRVRKWNKDLDEVFAGLDSDGELESEGDSHVGGLEESQDDTEVEHGAEGLEDDFVAVADGEGGCGIAPGDDNRKNGTPLEGILEEFREPRLLDEQFDKFLRANPLDFSDDDDDFGLLEEEEADADGALEDYKAHMTTDELDGLFGEGGDLLHVFANLNVASEENEEEQLGCQKENESSDVFEGAELNRGGQEDGIEKPGASSRAGWDDQERAAEYEKIAGQEFERGMTGLLDSYNRVHMDEAFDALDGMKEAMEAIARNEKEEMEEMELKIKLGLDDEESDGHDSELDSHFDEIFRNKDDKWDCETILSTYSNLDNHPSVIDAPASSKPGSVKPLPIIRLDPRTQAPVEFVPSFAEGRSKAKTVDFGTRRRVVKEIQARRKKETREEKKVRKSAVKEAARERRALKSEMKKAFASEHIKQSRHATAMGSSKVALQF